MNPQLEKLNSLLSLLEKDKMTTGQLGQVVGMFSQLLRDLKESIEKSILTNNSKIAKDVMAAIAEVDIEKQAMEEKIKTSANLTAEGVNGMKLTFIAEIKRVEALIPKLPSLTYLEERIAAVADSIPDAPEPAEPVVIPPPLTAVEVRDKLESLVGGDRIDITAIKGVVKRDKALSDALIERAIGIVDQRTSFLINKVSNLADRVNRLNLTGGGTIGGSIAATQIAYGSGANAITGSNNATLDSGGNATFAGTVTSPKFIGTSGGTSYTDGYFNIYIPSGGGHSWGVLNSNGNNLLQVDADNRSVNTYHNNLDDGSGYMYVANGFELGDGDLNIDSGSLYINGGNINQYNGGGTAIQSFTGTGDGYTYTAMQFRDANSGSVWEFDYNGPSNGDQTMAFHYAPGGSFFPTSVWVLKPGASDATHLMGVNTSSPIHNLHIVGDGYFTGAFYDSSNSAGSAGNILTSTGTASAWSSISALKYTYAAKSANYTILTTDDTIEVTATGKTITLPTAVSATGKTYTIKLTASGSGTVATTSSQTIDGSTTYSLSAQYKYVTVMSNGANWLIIANN